MARTASFRRQRHLISVVVLGAFVALGAVRVGHAAGTDTDETPKCEKDEVFDKSDKKCVKQKDKKVSDADRTEYAYVLAKARRYDEALALLDTLAEPNTARALNYRGYATRKLGRTDEGIGYYLKAVALDPKYAKVREYLGEAYVIKGRVDLAKRQLVAIRELCGTGCGEYVDLDAAIRSRPKAW